MHGSHCLLISHSISKASSLTEDPPFGIKITMGSGGLPRQISPKADGILHAAILQT